VKSLITRHFRANGLVSSTPRTESGEQVGDGVFRL
jgi:hypothetical protein